MQLDVVLAVVLNGRSVLDERDARSAARQTR